LRRVALGEQGDGDAREEEQGCGELEALVKRHLGGSPGL
jgi:hypothetical protein